MSRKTFSIVVPVYFNEMNLPDTVPQLLALGDRLPGYRLELVFVDDGSEDRSLEVLLDYQRRHPGTIKVVKLTRNFGAMAAIQAGFTAATGDCVGMISADLQDPPELFVEMVGHWERGVKAVFAVRSDRDEPLMQKAVSNTFYALLRRFAIRHYPPGGFDFFVIDRQVVADVNRMHEKNTNLMALIFWLGYAYVAIPYVRRRRLKGRSRWTLGKKFKLFIDSFVAFSYTPIRLLSTVGLLFAASALVYGAFIIIRWLTIGTEVRGWASVVVLLALTAGLQLLMLGLLGEYLWRTLDATRRRPLYVVDRVYDGAAPDARAGGEPPARGAIPEAVPGEAVPGEAVRGGRPHA